MTIEKKLIDDILYDTGDAIINNEFTNFQIDYLLLHSLIRKFNLNSILEIGTNKGTGTKIIKNAIGKGEVLSVELPVDKIDASLYSTATEGKDRGDLVGIYCNLPYTQLRGDSMTFDYSELPCEGYFVDGAHTTYHVAHETRQILKQNPKIIIYHDADMIEVREGIISGYEDSKNKGEYQLYIVEGTRIAYLLRNNL